MTLQHWENKKAVKTYGYENQRTKLIGRMCQCILLIIIVYSMFSEIVYIQSDFEL